MSDEMTRLQTEIANLQAAISYLAASPELQRQAQDQLAEKEQRLAVIQAQSGGINFGVGSMIGQTGDIVAGNQSRGSVDNQGRINGNTVGVNYGTIQAFFGGSPTESGETLLMDYLIALERDCQRLHLARLTGRRQSGTEQRAAPNLRLQEVYTSLTTDGPAVVVHERERSTQRVQRLITWLEQHPQRPMDVEPRQIREIHFPLMDEFDAVRSKFPAWGNLLRHMIAASPTRFQPADVDLSAIDPAITIRFELTRPELALEAIRQHHHLVLLGEPGHGKSTVLRYLALLLAYRLRGAAVDLPEWPADDTPIPILLPLGQVAASMAQHDGDARKALWQVLGDVLEGPEGLRAGLREHLKPAVRAGAVLLLCDGLDELPAEGAGGSVRARVAAALRSLADGTQSRMVVTSRVLPYRAAVDWQLPAEEDWHERTIQPLAFGQVRAFVRGWYRALADSIPELASTQAQARAASLIAELEQNERLRPLVQSPLLLTMLAILHANSRDGEIPRERVRLYDECVQLLLERWEPVRTLGLQRPGLLERLGNLPGLEIDKLRDVIHELAFQAHDQPPDDDGRGRLDSYNLSGRLLGFFRRLRSPDSSGNVATFLDVVRTDAGLLVARDDERAYAFPHLTFQEFLAACWLADQPKMADIAYARWTNDDRERWRTVLLLLAGRLRQKGQKDVERDGAPWLQALADATAYGQAKPPTQRRRDAVLAALSYNELGGRAALATSLRDLVRQVEDPLRDAVIDLLETPDSAILPADRIAAARVLADLDDPRFPVTLAQWQAQAFAPTFGSTPGYWCYIPAKTYVIGGWDNNEQPIGIGLPTFWIARFPITIAQYAPFVKHGYSEAAKRWWTPYGWMWRWRRSQPRFWNRPLYDGANQPVIGVTWYEATAFCAWLTEQLVATLPQDYVIRLPTEAEWEAAAAFDGSPLRLNYPWGADAPTLEHAIYNESQLSTPAPVGCCPAGAAACGALDMAGNVWEMMASSYQDYPERSDKVIKDFTTIAEDVPWRGGSYYNISILARCAARDQNTSLIEFSSGGFRVVVAPRSH